MSESFAELRESVEAELHNAENGRLKACLDWAETRTGVAREKLLYVLLALLCSYLVLGRCAELLCNTVGFAYPCFRSFKAIETVNKDDDTQWLTYWTVFAAASLLDFGADVIMRYVPIYFLAKCIFLLYLYLPMFRGAEKLYRRLLVPFFERYGNALFEVAESATTKVAAQQILDAVPDDDNEF